MRTVVAPSRFLQNAAKSWSPTRPPAASSIAADVEAVLDEHRVATTQRVEVPGVVTDPVEVAALGRREPRVEPAGARGTARTTTSDGEYAGQSRSRSLLR